MQRKVTKITPVCYNNLMVGEVKRKEIVVMKPYIHKVQYYETDKMGITHHSNYIRWMEEARVDFMERSEEHTSELQSR